MARNSTRVQREADRWTPHRQGGRQPTNFNFEALVGWLLSHKRSGWLVVPT